MKSDNPNVRGVKHMAFAVSDAASARAHSEKARREGGERKREKGEKFVSGLHFMVGFPDASPRGTSVLNW